MRPAKLLLDSPLRLNNLPTEPTEPNEEPNDPTGLIGSTEFEMRPLELARRSTGLSAQYPSGNHTHWYPSSAGLGGSTLLFRTELRVEARALELQSPVGVVEGDTLLIRIGSVGSGFLCGTVAAFLYSCLLAKDAARWLLEP